MQQFKSRLTRIKGSLESKLPEGPDIYGYSGVDKAMLLRTCDDIYALAELMEAKDTPHQFEIIVLKRFEARIHEGLKKFLDEDAGTPKAKDKFDDFLDKFSRLYERTKQAYFIVSKDGLRDELEIQALLSQISSLKDKQTEYESLVEELQKNAEAARIRADEIEIALTNATSQITTQTQSATNAHAEIHENLGAVRTWHGEISSTHGKMAGWDKEVSDTLEATKTNATAVATMLGQLQTGITDLTDATQKSKELTDASNAIHGQNVALIEEIRNTLGDSNRVGMAASFKEQMGLIHASQDQWKWIFIITLGVFAGVSIFAIALHLQGGTATWQSALSRFAMASPLIWLAWFAARQYGFANRVREDYTYKYASAMAYEGYKKAVREVDPTLEKSLVEVAIMNMAQNPVRLYSPKESDHASPFSEFFDKIFGRVKGVKATANPSGVSAEANLDLDPEKGK